jgi:hypothetical protein
MPKIGNCRDPARCVPAHINGIAALAVAQSLPYESSMTFRIEKTTDGHRHLLRLIGRIQAQHLDELTAQLENSGSTTGLDLEQLTLVDVDVVRFLGVCEARGTDLVHVPPYVRAWIVREAGREARA